MKATQSIIFCVSIFLAAQPVLAGKLLSCPPTERELAVLPEFCKVKRHYGMNRSNAQVQKWMSILGPAYLHVHHYCSGRAFEIRSNRMDGQSKYYLRSAYDNYDYLVKRVDNSFRLLPELHVRMGRVAKRMGQTGKAVQHYHSAMRAKPDYTPAYAALSDLYVDSGQEEEAREILEKGLKKSPDSNILRRRLDEL